MIAEQDDNRVVPVPALVESIEHASDLAVDVRDGREVPLNSLLPASGFQHQIVI
jgi:hypothetical protein